MKEFNCNYSFVTKASILLYLLLLLLFYFISPLYRERNALSKVKNKKLIKCTKKYKIKVGYHFYEIKS